MKRLPNKKYQRLCAQYNKAIQRACRLEILLDELVNEQLAADQRERRDLFPCTNAGTEDAFAMRSFLVPMQAEILRWQEGGDE